MLEKLVKFGDERLFTPSKNVTELDDEIKELIQSLKDTLKFYQCAGLSAVQIGYNINVFVGNVDGVVKTFINAEIMNKSSDKLKEAEGCMSLPFITILKERHEAVVIKYKNEEFEDVIESFFGWNAKLIQHEIEHCAGKLMISELSPTSRDVINTKVKRLKKTGKWTLDEILFNLNKPKEEAKSPIQSRNLLK